MESVHMSHPQNTVAAPADGGTVVIVTGMNFEATTWNFVDNCVEVNHSEGDTNAEGDDFTRYPSHSSSTARADHEIYSDQLLTKKRGYPQYDIQKTMDYGLYTYLASSSVRKSSSNPSQTTIGQRFESTATEAAILIMPKGATTQNLLNSDTWLVRQIVIRNAKVWYQYATYTRGRKIKDGDIRVLVGFDKVTSPLFRFGNAIRKAARRQLLPRQ